MRVIRTLLIAAAALQLSGCLGGVKALKITDFTETRVTDLSLTKKVTGKRDFVFFSTARMSLFLEGDIQGVITDYRGNPIEGISVKVSGETRVVRTDDEAVDSLEQAAGRNAASAVNLSFSPGITDTMGVYKIRFSVPITQNIVDLRGRLAYNPGWDQQRVNLGKAYEPQVKETPFRLYYNMNTGILVFAEGVRKVIVEPVGEGKGKLQALPGSKAPGAAPSAPPPRVETAPARQAPPAATPAGGGEAEEDLFKGFDFGQ
jgi:hypothetical protein